MIEKNKEKLREKYHGVSLKSAQLLEEFREAAGVLYWEEDQGICNGPIKAERQFQKALLPLLRRIAGLERGARGAIVRSNVNKKELRCR